MSNRPEPGPTAALRKRVSSAAHIGLCHHGLAADLDAYLARVERVAEEMAGEASYALGDGGQRTRPPRFAPSQAMRLNQWVAALTEPEAPHE